MYEVNNLSIEVHMYSNYPKSLFEKIIDYVTLNFIKIIVSATIFLLIAVPLFIISNKEDPNYTTYSCSNILPENLRKKLPYDKTIHTSSSVRIETEMNYSSIVLDRFTSIDPVADLVKESVKLISLVNQNNNDSKPNSLIIPKSACFLSNGEYRINQYQLGFEEPIVPNFDIYQWTKTYRTYITEKEITETNYIINMDNHYYVHFKATLKKQFFIIPVFKTQAIFYTLN